MKKTIGISQKIKRSWMDALTDQLVQTDDEVELRAFLDEYLRVDLPGKESRAKAAGIVLRIWSGIPVERFDLRNRAIELLPQLSGDERILLHWGMTALAYPFFRDTAEVIGRLQSLQDDFTTTQVQARMLTMWGDRATNTEAVQKLITSMVDWGVLRATERKGHFLPAKKAATNIPDLQFWLLEALMTASAADEIESQKLLRLPESFPFSVSVGISDLRNYEGFIIHRQGLDMDMVALNKVMAKRSSKPRKQFRMAESNEQAQLKFFDKTTK